VGYIVSNTIEVSIFINNVEIPLDTNNILNFLHMGCTTHGALPTCHFAVTDVRHSFDSIPLQDGIPIRITIKPGGNSTQTYNFRKFHSKKVFNGNAYVYEVDGYWDAAKYWMGTSVAGLRGTSSDVLSQIASTCGLQYDGVTTNDSQLWMQRNRTYFEFAKKTVDRGYVNDTSCMSFGVDLTGTMRYRNVNALPAPTTKLVHAQLVQGAYTVMQYTPVAKSGINNKMTGYANVRNDQSLIAPAISTPFTTLAVTPDSTSILMNTTVKSQVVRGYQSYGGLDMGNTHDSYEKAVYQNLRYSNLFSLDVVFFMYTPTTLTLFDTFAFAAENEVEQQDVDYSGNYTIAARAIFITGATYSEKLLCTRQGTNAAYTVG
jgi:hypothetical protein